MSLPRIKDLVLATKTQRLQFLDSVSALIDSTDASMSKPTGHEASSDLSIAAYVIENIDNLILLGVVGYTAVDAAAFHKALSSVNGPQELAQQMLDKMATERTIADNVIFDAKHAELYRDYTEQIDVNGGLSPEASNLWLSFEQTASTILPFVTTALNLKNSGRSQQEVRDVVSTQVRNIADVSGYRNLAVIQEIINVLMIDGIEEVDATDEYDYLVTVYKQKFYDVVASGTSFETQKIVEAWEEMSEIDEAGLYLIIARFLDAIDPYDKNTETTDDTISARIEAKNQLIEKFGIDGIVIGKILQRFYRATGLGGLLSEQN